MDRKKRPPSLSVKLFVTINAVVLIVTAVGLIVDTRRQYNTFHSLTYEKLTDDARTWRKAWVRSNGVPGIFMRNAAEYLESVEGTQRSGRFLMIVEPAPTELGGEFEAVVSLPANIDPVMQEFMLANAHLDHVMDDAGEHPAMLVSLPVDSTARGPGGREITNQFVVVARYVDDLQDFIRTEVISRIGFSVVMVLWVLVIINLVLARWVTGPLHGLSAAAGRLGRRDYDAEIQTDWGTREIDGLAASLDRARAMLHHVEQERVADLARARRTQTALLPSLDRHIPGLKVVGRYKPADQVGGDFYDLQSIGEGTVMLMIGDATGHGIAAALMMAMIKMDLNHLVGHGGASPGGLTDLAENLNADLLSVSEPVDFVSLFVLQLNVRHGVARFLNAGHIPGQLLRRDGSLESLDATGPLIGVLDEEVDWNEQTLTLLPGDRLVLTTDGLMEVENEKGVPFGLEQLGDVVIETRDLDPESVLQKLEQRVSQWVGQQVSKDDVTILVMDYLGVESEGRGPNTLAPSQGHVEKEPS